MNFHHSILVHAAVVERLQSFKELYNIIGLIEEKSSVTEERWRLEGISHFSCAVEVVSHDVSCLTLQRAGPLGGCITHMLGL
jgi:hypothetical protein